MHNNLPQGWVECELKELIDLQNGYAFSSKDYVSYSNTLNIRMSNIRPNGIFDYNHNIKYLPDDYAKKYSDYILNDGDLIIAMTDMADNSKILGVPTLVKRSDNQNFLMNQRVGRLLPNSESVYIPFLKYVLVSPKVRDVYKKKGKGGLQLNLSKNDILSIYISIPPLNEQKRIVEKIEKEFEKIDEGIEKLKLVQEQVNQYKQSVLKSAFEGKLYKTTEWEETTLGESIETRNERITPNKENSEMPFIGMDCIKPNCLNIHEKYKLKDTKSVSALFKKNDVLYGRMRSYLNKVWKAEFDGSASAEFIIFKENKKIIADFLKYLLHQQDFVKYATRNASGDRPRVKFESDLADYKFLLPSREEQVQIIFQIEKRFEVADNVAKIVEENLEKAEQLKQSILKKAFEGRIVPQYPTDEPASFLLERIKKEREK